MYIYVGLGVAQAFQIMLWPSTMNITVFYEKGESLAQYTILRILMLRANTAEVTSVGR